MTDVDRPAMTEAELVLATCTNEELLDAIFFLHVMKGRWDEHVRYMERTGGVMTGYDRADGWHGTTGPLHAIRALDTALIREMAVRAGADPWDARQSSEGHPHRALIEYYRERLELNPDLGSIPRLSAAGVLEQVCPSCDQAKPLTVAFWRWLGSSMDTFCRQCRVEGEQEAATTLRDALIAQEDAQATPSVPVEAFTPAELDVEQEVAL